MRNTLIRHLSAIFLACSAATAFAAEPAWAEAPRVEVIVDRAALAAAEVVLAQAPFDQRYEMSTGRRLAVASHGSALKVRYGGLTRATLRHDGQGRFVSNDGVLTLRFKLDEAGEPQVVTLNLPAQWQ
jgi:hypothetical protein